MGIRELKAQVMDKVDSTLFAVVFAPSGSGKSTLIGTLNVPTLFLYTSSESHGLQSCRSMNKNEVFGVCIDKKEDADEFVGADKLTLGATLTADQSLLKINYWITQDLKGAGFKAISLDSLADFELLTLQSTFVNDYCRTEKGGKNTYKTGEAFIVLLQSIINKLLTQKANGLHIIMTCPAHVTQVSEEGGVETIMPVLSGYQVGDKIARLFAEVLFVSKVDGKHQLIFDVDVKRASKDQQGNLKKMLNFSCRISGVLSTSMPETLPADLKEVIKLKSKA